MPSLNSANCASRASRGLDVSAEEALREERREERELGRRGVAGREGMRVREAERERVAELRFTESAGIGFVGVLEDMVVW